MQASATAIIGPFRPVKLGHVGLVKVLEGERVLHQAVPAGASRAKPLSSWAASSSTLPRLMARTLAPGARQSCRRFQ